MSSMLTSKMQSQTIPREASVLSLTRRVRSGYLGQHAMPNMASVATRGGPSRTLERARMTSVRGQKGTMGSPEKLESLTGTSSSNLATNVILIAFLVLARAVGKAQGRRNSRTCPLTHPLWCEVDQSHTRSTALCSYLVTKRVFILYILDHYLNALKYTSQK